MSDAQVLRLPSPTAEQRRVAAGQFERANQVLTTGNHDYGIQLLLTCCKLNPGNLIYRQALRHAQKGKYKNNLRGSPLAFLTTWRTRLKLRSAVHRNDLLQVMQLSELILSRNPWDLPTQFTLAEAFAALELVDQAIWVLEQARQKHGQNLEVNRQLARLYEKRGNFSQAIKYWEMIRQARPSDREASNKAKDIAASATIARGGYEQVLTGPVPASARKKPDEPAVGDTAVHAVAETVTAAPLATDRLTREVSPLYARVEADPTNPNAYMNLAYALRRGGEIDKAREVLQKGLAPTGNDFNLALELADVNLEPFRHDLALTEGKLREQPNDDELRRIRARLKKEINARELELFSKKSERHPAEASYRYELGVRLLHAGQIDEAIKELQRTRNDPRHHWKSLLHLGYCFKNRKNWKLAQRNFEEALHALPPAEESSRKDLLYQLATGCADHGDLPRAVELGFELANLDFSYRRIGLLAEEWQRLLEAGAERLAP